jgi:hypothetical protein
MLDGNEDVVEAQPAEYSGGRDISGLLDAASKDAATETPAVTPPATEAAAPATVADTQAAVAKAWKLYRDGKEVADFDPTKMTAAEFLTLKVGYNANGKEHQRDFEGILRNAQQGHYNAQKAMQIEQEREHALRQWKENEGKVTTYEGERKVWQQALTAATRGNFEPLRLIVAEFQKAIDAGEPEAPQVPEGYVAQADLDRQAAGEQVYQQHILPAAEKLAKEYGFTQQQVATAIMKLVEMEPAEYLTMQKLQNIMQVELPAMMRDLREQNPIQPPEPTAEQKRIEVLEAQIAKLSGKEVETKNAAVTAAHKRAAVAPPGVETVPGGSDASLETPNWDTAHGARDWLRNLK